MTSCPFGINGGEFPHWPVAKICDLAVKLNAQFVELSARRMAGEGTTAVGRELGSRRLRVHVNAGASELAAAFEVARDLGAPVIVVFDDAIERVDASRRRSLDDFRETVCGLIDRPGHEGIHLAIENSFIKITRQPEDLLAIIRHIGHPRVGVNFDADNFYNAGIEPFPYAYELLKGHIVQLHAKDSTRYLPAVHGDERRVLHRAGGNVICVPLGTGAVNWAGLVARLKHDGYRGAVSLEPHTLPEEMAGVMAQDAAYLRAAGLVA
jgi:sugar phosphate isomerase/epimerase